MTRKPAPAKKTRRKSPRVERGRPPTYDPDSHPERARKLTMLGLTQAELATAFGVDGRTIERWKARHKEFSRALWDGGEGADADVAVSMHKRAKGFTKKKVETVSDPTDPKKSIVKVTEEEVPPDLSAAKLWMHNRQRPKGRWSSDPDAGVGAAVGQGLGAILASIDGATRGLGYEADQARDEPDDD